MKIKFLFLSIIIAIAAVFLCSCSTDSMRQGDGEVRNAVRRGENAIDRGIGSIGDGIENSMDIITGGSAGNGSYGAYSAADGGMAYADRGRASNILPTLGDTSRDNYGQVNTTNGKADGGMGDMYSDTNTRRNSLRSDMLN